MTNNDVHYLTKDGFAELEAKLLYLRTERRQEIAERLHQALEEAGELFENAEYDDAKNNQAFVESEIRRIEEILNNSEIIDDLQDRPRDIVTIGSRVTVCEKGIKETEEYILVGPPEANPRLGKISYKSPFGKALMEQKVGDKITVQAPDGKIVFEIKAID